MSYTKSYNQGMIDGIELWGKGCSGQGDCEDCPIGSVSGANVTCADFARQFPAKMLSILKEMNEDGISYYNEYCMRFPAITMSVDVLASCMCRKTVFEGYLDCPVLDCEADDPEAEEKCIACWKEQYIGDKTEEDEDEDEEDDEEDDDEDEFI